MKSILVPVDFSDCAKLVIEAAIPMAKALAASVTLIHVAQPEPEFIGYEPGPQTVRDSVAKELVEEHRKIRALEKAFKDAGVSVTALVFQGYPVEKIEEQALKHHVDMIIMGSHGHGALHNLLVGSVTEGVMRRAICPVLVVPSRAKA